MNSPTQVVVVGLDVGTSGVRSIAVTARGEVRAEARASLSDLPAVGAAHEQDAREWWKVVCRTLQELRRDLHSQSSSSEIAGISVTSTSGSLVLVDSAGEPVRPAMLYDDGRASGVAEELNARLAAGEAPLNASFSLAKALWVRQHEPQSWERAARILHPADWLAARLTGNFGISDYSNALKLGYDPERRAWNASVELSGIPAEMFPRIVEPGEQIGTVTKTASEATGLDSGIPVMAGASDGLASLVGSGAFKPGHANTTLGTTLVWKVLSDRTPVLGPGTYCHYLPGNLRVPGAASSTGPGHLQFGDAGVSPEERDRSASQFLPTMIQCYPLGSRGERFPAMNPAARAFVEGNASSPQELYAAELQALACIERWGYERLESAGVVVGDCIFSAGSAAASAILSQLRSNVLNRQILRSATPSASFGAAILAAATAFYGAELTRAMEAMTRVVDSCPPQTDETGRYDDVYRRFRLACSRQGLD